MCLIYVIMIHPYVMLIYLFIVHANRLLILRVLNIVDTLIELKKG